MSVTALPRERTRAHCGTVRALMVGLAALLALLSASPARAGTTADERVLRLIEAEESAASDAFAAFDALYESRPLSRIAREEARHVRIVRGLLDEEPSGGRTGHYAGYPGLQQDYWAWLAEGYVDLHSAATVGIEIEKRHLALLAAALAVPQDAVTRRNLERIRRQDARHLTTCIRLLQRTPSAQPCASASC